MSTESWQADNHRYLVASLQWLRLRLQRLATEEPRGAASDATPPNSPGSSADEERGLIQRSFASGPPATKERLLSSEPQWSPSEADDYRYATRQGAHVDIRSYHLPGAWADRCRELAAAMELPVAGIDLRCTPEGQWYCFEVNPSPAFTYYQGATGQPIAETITKLLAE